jgi:hypothetical protein
MAAITEMVDLDRRGRIAVLAVNHPPVKFKESVPRQS